MESIPVAIENITILNGEFHNLNLVFHKEILVSGLRKHFHSIQNVRIRLYTDFGGLRMAEKITPFFFCQNVRKTALYCHQLVRSLIYHGRILGPAR